MTTFAPVPKPDKKSRSKKGEMPKVERVPASKRSPKHLERDEFELEDLAYTINEAKEGGTLKEYVIYHKEQPLRGIVTKMDAITKLIHITDTRMDIHKVHFLDILKVSSVEYW